MSSPRHVQLDARTLQRENRERPWSGSVYYRTPLSYRSTHSGVQSSQARTPMDPHSPRASVSTLQLQHLLERLEMDQYNTYGVEELRDGFFDPSFYRPIRQDHLRGESKPLIAQDVSILKRPSLLILKEFWNTQISDARGSFRIIFTTTKGISLAKSFLAYFAAYIMCLVPHIRLLMGRYSYWILIATLFNHPGRTFGAQIDGTVSCTFGGALGLAVGTLALEIASSTQASRVGNRGVLTVFIVIFIGVASWIRCSLVRVYQTMISAGLAFLFLCLVGVDSITQNGKWDRMTLWEFGIPWIVGLGICLIINIIIWPEAGGKAVAYEKFLRGSLDLANFVASFHKALRSALAGLIVPRPYSPEAYRNMSLQLVNLSEAIRDMRSEIIFSSLKPEDSLHLRNLLQAVIRDIMAVRPDVTLFDDQSTLHTVEAETINVTDSVVIDIPHVGAVSSDTDVLSLDSSMKGHLRLVRDTMATPARELIDAMIDTLLGCDTTLMWIVGHKHLPRGSNNTTNTSFEALLARLQEAMRVFDGADISLIDHPDLPCSYAAHPDLVKLFLFIHPVRQTADSILKLATKVIEISRVPGKRKFYLPSYPLSKSLYRASPQVRHDRGGVSAGYYFKSKQNIEDVMEKYHARPFDPSPDIFCNENTEKERQGRFSGDTAEPETFRYKAWKLLHRLQQFESRFAFKVVLVTTLLSVPAWTDSRGWYIENEAWWSVIAAWFMMHPRVGGNTQDLITRSIATAIGALWGGLAYFSGDGNPYVMAVFAAMFMVPCIFRFTTSLHPQSGLMACISFSVVSMSIYTLSGEQPATKVAWTRGVALITGIVSAVVVNWVIWPFVARHELRKSLSFMMLNLGISYRSVVGRYIYYDINSQPTEEDLERSEIQEARLREGFVRMRELLEMTRHEIRIRGPFNSAPYSAAIYSCERFLEHIVEVRQSSLFFQPFLFGGTEEFTRKMIPVRRDAVASILMNLYILAGALRAKRPVPTYLPSAAAARKRLLDRMAEIEEENQALAEVRPRLEKCRRWADVYQYAYSSALTDIVEQLEQLQIYTKAITGEMALDFPDCFNPAAAPPPPTNIPSKPVKMYLFGENDPVKCIVYFAQIHETFRKAELDSLAELHGFKIEWEDYRDTCPFSIIALASRKEARKLVGRSILARGIYELWGVAPGYNELHKSIQANTAQIWPSCMGKSFKFDVEVFNGKRSQSEQRKLIEQFAYLGLDGPIKMKNPDMSFSVMEEYESAHTRIPTRVFFGRLLAIGSRHLVDTYDLKKRHYIGTTSMDAELSLITANFALAAPGKTAYDPFVGTGSFIVSCSHFGSHTLGSDIDGRQIRGKKGRSVLGNFKQYGLVSAYLDGFVSDLTNTPLRKTRFLDAIVCDPPYGVREGLKVLGSRDPEKGKEPAVRDGELRHLQDDYVPPKRPYSFLAMLDDILQFAADHLVAGGRLCFWVPTANEDFSQLDIPTHPELELVSVCVQEFNKWSRRLLTYSRNKGDPAAEQLASRSAEIGAGISETGKKKATADELNTFRKKYFEGFKPVS